VVDLGTDAPGLLERAPVTGGTRLASAI